jgi:phospholipase C
MGGFMVKTVLRYLLIFSLGMVPMAYSLNAEYSLTVSPATVVAGGAVTVTWTSPANSPVKDWIASYQDADSGNQFKTYIYTKGATSGTWHTTAWGGAGHSCKFRLLGNDGYGVMATSNVVQAKAITPVCPVANKTTSNIQHLVVIVQENKSFDSYFGNYCAAPVGSNPTCTTGPACCEKAPITVQGVSQTVLTDNENASFDPNHSQACEVSEINGGLMDKFVAGATCGSNPRNFAVADRATLGAYWDYATKYSMADRCFQPVAGASSSNDMYLARGAFVFVDNSASPNARGKECFNAANIRSYSESTIGDLLNTCSVKWTWYGGGYAVKATDKDATHCYPNYYDASDNPFQYYPTLTDQPAYNKDYTAFAQDIAGGTLPAVSYIKAIGTKSEHGGGLISAGVGFIDETVKAVLNSPTYSENTLVLLTYDEGGGYYDHISPPATSLVDGQPYGPRQPLIAIGYFAKPNTVSHVQMEHASIVAFIEWNWLGGITGQLQTRDLIANNIGSLLDSTKTGVIVPSMLGPTVLGLGSNKSFHSRSNPTPMDHQPQYYLGRKRRPHFRIYQ